MNNAVRAIVFCVFLTALLFGMSKLFDFAAAQDLREKARWIMHKRGESYDFAVIGSSRALVGMDVATMERELGQKGINLALDGTTFPEQYLGLALFLEDNTVRHLIMDVTCADFDNDSFKTPFHAYSYLPMVQHDTIFTNLVANFGWRAYAWRYVPFFKNAEFNSKIGMLSVYSWLKSFRDPQVKKTDFDAFGTRMLQRKFDEQRIKAYADTRWQIQSLPRDYFFRILDLAREKSIKVTLTMTPEYHVWTERQLNRPEVLAIYENAAQERKIKFLNFQHHELGRDKTNFFDRNHLNKTAALKFSQDLAVALKRSTYADAAAK